MGGNEKKRAGLSADDGERRETDATIQSVDRAAQQSDNFRKQFHFTRHPIGSHAGKPMGRASLLLPHSGS